MGRMATVVAHEIRNPLGIVKATAQRLKKLDPAKQEPLLDFIPQEIDRLDRILTGYLQFADIRVTRSESLAVTQVIESALARTMRYGQENGVTIEKRDFDDFTVPADRDALERALENLLRNAVDASPGGSTVTIDCRVSGKQGQVIVSDQGSGIPKKERKKIFEPFHTTKTRGSGLGLYAARTTLVKMGGNLKYRPREHGERGSRFIITLPLAR